jgi:16S rRNA (guanine527-N7)-methyltransferase
MEDSPEALKELKNNVSRETINKLDTYRTLILSEKQSLISKKDKNLIWTRHFYDSLRISDLIRDNKQNIIDIGSGSGLPGIPLSLLYNGENSIFLCENRKKRVKFLEHCIDELKLKNTYVIPHKAEKATNQKFDIVLARAVGRLNDLLSISYNISKKNTTFLFHKGIHIDDEIDEATKYWKFDHILHENSVEKGSYILELNNVIKSIT